MRSQDDHEEAAAIHAAVAAVAAAAEHAGKTRLRQQGDGSGERGRNGTGQDVTILHMPQLVRQHPFQFLVVEKIENPLGDRNRGMAWGCARWQRRWVTRWG